MRASFSGRILPGNTPAAAVAITLLSLIGTHVNLTGPKHSRFVASECPRRERRKPRDQQHSLPVSLPLSANSGVDQGPSAGRQPVMTSEDAGSPLTSHTLHGNLSKSHADNPTNLVGPICRDDCEWWRGRKWRSVAVRGYGIASLPNWRPVCRSSEEIWISHGFSMGGIFGKEIGCCN